MASTSNLLRGIHLTVPVELTALLAMFKESNKRVSKLCIFAPRGLNSGQFSSLHHTGCFKQGFCKYSQAFFFLA